MASSLLRLATNILPVTLDGPIATKALARIYGPTGKYPRAI